MKQSLALLRPAEIESVLYEVLRDDPERAARMRLRLRAVPRPVTVPHMPVGACDDHDLWDNVPV